MHDDLIERRLRSALRDEADRLPLTITAAELERRAVLRGRGVGNRRLGLLLAAAVGLGLVGVGSVIGGLVKGPTDSSPVPTAPGIVVNPTVPVQTRPAGAKLPTLDELVAADPASIVFAQSHGPLDGPVVPPPGGLDLGGASGHVFPVLGTGSFDVEFGCLGDTSGYVALWIPDTEFVIPPTQPCDGKVRFQTFAADGPRLLVFATLDRASWAVVARWGSDTRAQQSPQTWVLEVPDGQEQLVRFDESFVEPLEPLWGDAGLLLRDVGAVPGRSGYDVRVLCEGGNTVRVLFGDQVEGAMLIDTESQVVCDGVEHVVNIGIAYPDGSKVYVAAKPDVRWSLLVTSTTPPVALVDDMSGWQLAAGYGPELAFETHGAGFSSGGVEGGGPLLVALECAGTADPIEVRVDLSEPLGDAFETFTAECVPEGARTAMTFHGEFFIAEYTAPAGTWTALSILVPDPLPEP